MKYTVPIIIGVIVIVLAGVIIAASSKKNDSNTPPINTNTPLAVTADDQVRGSSDAPITLVEYSDFQCPYCVKFFPVMMQLTNDYQGKVRWVSRSYPLPFHNAAKGAALAAEAAGKQAKFWDFSTKLIENSQSDGKGIEEADLVRYAQDLGLDMNKFNTDRKDAALSSKIDVDKATGDALKIQGTPSLFMVDKNGTYEQLEPGTLEELKAKIDAKLQ